MKAQIKLAVIAGVLSLAASGLPFSCEGITSNGYIKGQTVDPRSGWTAVSDTKFGGRTIRGIAYGGGKFVAVGDNGKGAYSTDGVTWTPIGDMKLGTGDIYGVVYGAGKFVAGSYTGGVLVYSTDGENWISGTITGTPFGIIDVAYGGVSGSEKFIAVGYYANIAYSSDGVSWTKLDQVSWFYGDTIGTSNIRGIAYGGGKFVAVGDNGKGAYSTDGVTWTPIGDMKLGTNNINAIAYGGGKFVAVGDNGKGAYSADGVTWTAVILGTGDLAHNTFGITYGGSKFVASRGSTAAALSFDGIAWTDIDVEVGSGDLYGIAYGNGKFVTVGYAGKAFYSSLSNITARLVFGKDGVVKWVKG